MQASPGSSNVVAIIDHVLFGRPFYMEGSDISGPTPISACPKNLYAERPEEVCVVRNALAAVIYWCQGKDKCEFSKYNLEDAAKFKQYFLAKRSSSLNGYEEAAAACNDGKGQLAQLTNVDDARDVKKMVMKQDQRILKDRQHFWVARKTGSNLHKLNITWTSKDSQESDCLILSKVFDKVRLIRHIMFWINWFELVFGKQFLNNPV